MYTPAAYTGRMSVHGAGASFPKKQDIRDKGVNVQEWSWWRVLVASRADSVAWR